MLHLLTARLRALLRWRTLDRDIHDEIDAHVERDTTLLVSGGMSLENARAEARRRFGNVALEREQARDAYGFRWPSQVIQDAKYGVRSLARTPGFTLVAVLSLGVAIGANTTVFSAVEALLLRPLPIPEPARLVTVEQTGQGGDRALNLALPDYERLRRLPVFAGAAAVTWADAFNVSTPGAAQAVDPGPLRVSVVTGDFFRVLGVRARTGRLLTEADDEGEGGSGVVVISDEYWRRRFDRASNAVGSPLIILGTTYTIAGAAPPGFAGDWVGWPTDIWVPVSMANRIFANPPGSPRGGRRQFKVLARLADGASISAAEAAARVERDRILEDAATDTGLAKDRSLVLTPAATGYSSQRSEFRWPLTLLMGIVAALLVIGCANVAGLLLARGASRGPELAIRSALGAGRPRLIRQLLTESTMLTVAGSAAGIAFALIGGRVTAAIAASGPVTSVQWGPSSVVLDLTPDRTTLLFTILLGAAATLAFGLVPAMVGARDAKGRALVGRLTATRTIGGGRRLRSAVLVAQIAIALMLLSSGAGFVRALHRAQTASRGFDESHILLAWVLPGYAGADGAASLRQLRALEQAAATVPGVSAAVATANGMFGVLDSGVTRLAPVGSSAADTALADDSRTVAPGFFAATGQRLMSGRDFRDTDSNGAPRVLIVDETLARRLFGSSEPEGRRVAVGSAATPYEIVGVVSDARYSVSSGPTRATAYFPLAQARNVRRACLVIRTTGDPAALTSQIHQALAAADPQLPILEINTVAAQLDRLMFRERLVERMASAVASIALLLACLGVYGMASFDASRRSREISVLVALGAGAVDVVRSVGGQILRAVAIGAAIGAGATILLFRALGSRSAMLPPADPSIVAIVAAGLLVVGIVSAGIPMVRAAWRAPFRVLQSGD